MVISTFVDNHNSLLSIIIIRMVVMMIIIPGFHRASQSYLAARVQCSPDIGIADTDRVLQRLIQQQTTTTTKMSTMVMVMMEHHGR